MPAKRAKTGDRKALVDQLLAAVQAYVAAGNGKLLRVESTEIVQHRLTQFDLVVRCVGRAPKWDENKDADRG